MFGYGMFVPDLNFSIPNLDLEFKYFWIKNMEIWTEMFIPDPRSRIPPDFFQSWIPDPDPGVKKALDLRSESARLKKNLEMVFHRKST